MNELTKYTTFWKGFRFRGLLNHINSFKPKFVKKNNILSSKAQLSYHELLSY